MFQGIFDLDVTRFSNSSEKIMSPPVRGGGGDISGMVANAKCKKSLVLACCITNIQQS